MEDKVDLSAADKARLVWEAARAPKCGPLDDRAAETLGEDLEWAATWFETDCAVTSPKTDCGVSQTRKDDELKVLDEISRMTGALAKLLGNDNAAVRRLERFYDDPWQPKGPPNSKKRLPPPNLSEMQSGLEALKVAADKACVERRKVKPIPSPTGISSVDRYVFELAKIYESYTGRRAGVSVVSRKTKEGPFVRFVHEAARQFGIQPPAGATIAAALRKRKTTPEHATHVIGLVKYYSR
jgi:hypothetical protein